MMKRFSLLTLMFLSLTIVIISSCSPKEDKKVEWAIIVHGGAGGDRNAPQMPEEMQQKYKDALNEALSLGISIITNGGDAVDAVQAVLVYMEDNPLFNAGKGAVLNSEGKHELDAAIMDGRDLNAGAVAGLRDVKNPIKAARAVMDSSVHVLLMGEGASNFAKEQGLEIVDNSYFDNESSAAERKKILSGRQGKPHGTVGCVALDKKGNLAAATSTGGMSGKKWGRVGDVPIIGAGTYADNESVAVSGTGHGELWIRRVVGFDISALMKYQHLSVEEAAHEVIWDKIDKMKGSGGGVICVDHNGNIAMEFNTALMFRSYATSQEGPCTLIY